MVVITMGPAELKQRMTALEKANEVRVGRAALKCEVKAGDTDVCNLLDNPPALIHTMATADLLHAVPGWGAMKVNRTLRAVGILGSKAIGELTPRQRRDLRGAVATGRAPRPRYWTDLGAYGLGKPDPLVVAGLAQIEGGRNE